MDIKTKYNLGQIVIPIQRSSKEIIKNCKLCLGNGKITTIESGLSAICPECHGRKTFSSLEPNRWNVNEKFMSCIGKVQVEIYGRHDSSKDVYSRVVYENNYKIPEKPQIRYMISATGVGTGTVWIEEDLFETLEDAQTECDIRNSKLES